MCEQVRATHLPLHSVSRGPEHPCGSTRCRPFGLGLPATDRCGECLPSTAVYCVAASNAAWFHPGLTPMQDWTCKARASTCSPFSRFPLRTQSLDCRRTAFSQLSQFHLRRTALHAQVAPPIARKTESNAQRAYDRPADYPAGGGASSQYEYDGHFGNSL